jgi:uncharacterized protein (DUF2252 family)
MSRFPGGRQATARSRGLDRWRLPFGQPGPLADETGDIDIQIRDLDQSVIGNPVHDLIRLGLSLATTVRGSDLPGVTTARMLNNMLNCYEQAFGRVSKDPESRHKKPDSIREAMRRSLNRSWKQLATVSRIQTRRFPWESASSHCARTRDAKYKLSLRKRTCGDWRLR